jgi:ADP-ribose pyrophosphatase YjhB (NUDIX family)
MSEPLLQALQRLHAIAQTGLTYSKDPYDLERFAEVRTLAEASLARLLEVDSTALAQHYALDRGYPTPKVDVRTAVFSGDKLLLVREAADGLWTMPGGWADETDSPKEAAEREVREESGFEVAVTRLISLKDRRRHGYVPQLLGGCYKLFFLATLTGGQSRTSIETTDVEFFAVDRLPPLSLGRTLPEDVLQAHAAYRDPNVPLVFD